MANGFCALALNPTNSDKRERGRILFIKSNITSQIYTMFQNANVTFVTFLEIELGKKEKQKLDIPPPKKGGVCSKKV
jgi:hypothetical protein